MGRSDSRLKTASGLVARLKKASNECPVVSFFMLKHLVNSIRPFLTFVNSYYAMLNMPCAQICGANFVDTPSAG